MSDDEIEWTPAPGTVVPPEQAAATIAAFEKTFRAHPEGRPPETPAWCIFPPGATRTEPKILRSLQQGLSADEQLYFYFEGGRELRRATVGEIRAFVESLQPWEGWDTYVFDASMTWCIAFTHRQMHNEILVFQVGEVPGVRSKAK